MPCLFCEILAQKIVPPGGIIYQDKHMAINHAPDVLIPGYLFLYPKRHVEFYHDLSDDELKSYALTIKKISKILYSFPEVERLYISCFAEETRHLHFHLFPRYTWMKSSAGPINAVKLFEEMRTKYRTDQDLLTFPQIQSVIKEMGSSLDNGQQP